MLTPKQIGKLIRAMRRATGYNAREVAKCLDYPADIYDSLLYQVETGTQNGRIKEAYLKWLANCGITLDEQRATITIDAQRLLEVLNPEHPTAIGRKHSAENIVPTCVHPPADTCKPEPKLDLDNVAPDTKIEVRDLLEFILSKLNH